jgi:hypothetical protein
MKVLLAPLTLLIACIPIDLETPPPCNPLGGASCITPWPSSIYEVDDATSPTGRRIAIPAGALPTNASGIAIDPAHYNQRDGFSSAAPIVTAFPTGVDPSNLVHYSNYEASVTPASPTVLIDMSTGELVPHFAELNAVANGQPDRQALYIRPATLLKGGTRYAVAIKRTLKARDGGELPVPEGFQAILDFQLTTHEALERARERYLAIFVALAAHGIGPADLVNAWDFTTASRESVRTDLVAARDAALPLIGEAGANLTFTVTSTTTSTDPRIASRVDGTFDAPLFLTNGGSVSPTTALVRDAGGRPSPTGLYRANFTAVIPKCALASPTPVPIFIYGHGLLGTATQVAGVGGRHPAGELCMVGIGTNMRGMSQPDLPNVAAALGDLNKGGLVFDTLIQGMMNHIALVQAARGPMARDLFKKPTGESIVDPARVYYYGISQGGIMGTTACAIDPTIQRCVLQVGAQNFSMLLERSRDWLIYRTPLVAGYPDLLDQSLLLGLLQLDWDRTEATAVSDILIGDGFPGSPPKQVFLQMALGDDEVGNLATESWVRTIGVPVVTPSPYLPFGVPAATGPVANGLVIYDFGLGGTVPPTNVAPPDNNVHTSVLDKGATMSMMRRFLDTGEIMQMCTAPNGCDCPAGGCGAQL